MTEVFIEELKEIRKLIENRQIFIGKVSGLLSIVFNKESPEDFYPIHLNRTLSGISTSNLKGGNIDYTFKYSCSSFYELITEIHYIRMYAKYKKLEINQISLIIRFPSDKYISSDLTIDTYHQLLYDEFRDIERLMDLPRIFTGLFTIQYSIEFYENTRENINFEGNCSSFYILLADLEKIRNTSALDKNAIRVIKMELSELDDSRVFYRENSMKRKDEMARKKI